MPSARLWSFCPTAWASAAARFLRRQLHALVSAPWRRGGEGSNRLFGEMNRSEALLRIKIVVSGLVYDADISSSRSGLIRQNFVDLSDLEVCWLVDVNTDDIVSLRFFHTHSRKRFILNLRRPMPCASYQCNSTVRILPLCSRTVASPFSFRQRPRPYCFLNRARSRIPGPIAIASTSLISPISSLAPD